jgi:hypothetical protein
MAELIVIEVDCDPAVYPQVNKVLGLDPNTGSGDWPDGLISHVGGGSDGSVVVVEAWESRAQQEAWMASTLGPALGQVGVPQPKRMEWFEQLGNFKV